MYFEDPRRLAYLLNVELFHGKNRILPEDISERNPSVFPNRPAVCIRFPAARRQQNRTVGICNRKQGSIFPPGLQYLVASAGHVPLGKYTEERLSR